MQIRATYFYKLTPQLQLALSGGYEDNRIAVQTGDVLGKRGLHLQHLQQRDLRRRLPLRRHHEPTSQDFGSIASSGRAMDSNFSHRTPLTAWNASASRTGSS